MILLDDFFRLEGVSTGAEYTCFWLKPLDVLLDIGTCPRQVIPINQLLLSHAHMDHAAGLPYYVAQRHLWRLGPCTIYLPAQALGDISRILDAWQRLEVTEYSYTLIAVETGRRYQLTKDCYFIATPVQHRVPALGYTIFQEKIKLKPDYLGLENWQIAELRRQKADIFDKIERAKLSYLGDCNFASFLNSPNFRHSQYVLLECTFLDSEKNPGHARLWGHVHLDDIVEHADAFAQVEKLVLIHFSRRYRLSYIRESIAQKCPAWLRQKIILLEEHSSRIHDCGPDIH